MKTEIVVAQQYHPTEQDEVQHSKWHDLVAQHELQFDNLNTQHRHQFEDLMKRQEWQRKNLFKKHIQNMTDFAERAFSELKSNS